MTRIPLLLCLAMTGAVNAASTLWEGGLHEVAHDLEQRSSAAVNGWIIEPDTTLVTQEVEHLVISLPDRSELLFERQRVFRQSNHSLSWAGSGPEGSTVLLTVRDGWMGGLIQTDERSWEIRPDAEHGTVLLELDPTAFPECSGGLEPPHSHRNDDEHEHASGAAGHSLQQPLANSTEQTVVMDLLALYTPAARLAYGGTAQIEAHAEAAIANANHSFDNSDVDAQFRIVAIEEIDYNESNNCGNDLSWVRSSPAAQQLRDQYGADMVGMLVQVSYCGCGFVMRNPGPAFAASAYQVTATHCAVGNLTYAHEHGHNMGMEHDPANGTSSGNASYPFSFGHFVSGEYRTVMSYASECSGGCPRHMHFSNPDVRYNGYPTGIAEERDNASTARLTSPIIANFRNPIDPPQIELETDLLEASVGTHDPTAVAGLEIGNAGGLPLEWSIDPTSPDCQLPDWVATSTVSGMIDPGEQQSLEILFDGSDLVPDTYLANLCIDSNDPETPTSTVHLALDVIETEATLVGEVISLGYCKKEPTPLASALVIVQGVNSTYSTTTDPAGQFEMILPATEGPVSLTASASQHVTAHENDIDFTPGTVTSINLEMTARKPCADLSEDSLEFLLAADQATGTVTIGNENGGADLEWSFSDSDGCTHAETPDWLDISSNQGIVAAGNQSTIEITVNAYHLDIGSYTGGWCIDSNDPGWSIPELTVELEVLPSDILHERFEASDNHL